jgi:hypothetical protein
LLIQKEERKKKHIPCPCRFHLRWFRLWALYRSFVPSSSNKGCNRFLREIASRKHLRFILFPLIRHPNKLPSLHRFRLGFRT